MPSGCAARRDAGAEPDDGVRDEELEEELLADAELNLDDEEQDDDPPQADDSAAGDTTPDVE